MYLLRKETDASLPQIGEVLGGRDHTTVMYAIDKIANQIETKAELRKRVINVKQQLYGQSRGRLSTPAPVGRHRPAVSSDPDVI